ncbi:MAG: hypothetical protein AMS27_04255 [Bacteroides sp. SM23_62_1]|nr:MAG: hypothetical protein AMS27_04255 [Bacteroides sp. SM23_62_1]
MTQHDNLNKQQTTIFRQLIFNVVFPAIIALVVLGILNYQNTKKILVNSNAEKNRIIYDEITSIHELQDVTLEILEDQLNKRMEEISNRLISEYFVNTGNIETVNLDDIRLGIGMNPEFEDIYIINRNGIVINTTFEKDKNLNIFDFGIEHQNLLLQIFESGKYVSERFAIESNTKRLKKFTYQPSLDGKYIVELGIYSSKADEVTEFIKNRINDLEGQHGGILSVDLFIGIDHPFSLNSDAELNPDHLETYRKVIEDQQEANIREKEGKVWIDYHYIYLSRKKSDLYKGSVIQMIADYSNERRMLRVELMKFILIFGITLLIVVILLYQKTKVITDPIKRLVQKVNRITDGHLNERADVVGNNEITRLSEKFNVMIEQLESYTNDLEQKVKERTAEIEQQKEEIAAQRDSLEEQRNMLSEANANLAHAYKEIEEQKRHIEDSIHYAKRIQTAILPPDEYVSSLLPDYFIFYLPKDIVSGDFYWVNKKDGRVYVAAVDCTGHGVPGAFMSIVGHDQLDYSVNVVGARTPAEILNALNKGVTGTLRQSRIEVTVKDGMDIALCSIDFEKNKLEYAGAFNPLYLFRDHELIHYDADKFPVGAFIGEELQHFTNNSVEVKKGDMIFIFSDGYADQFGGPKHKKFMIKRFRELLSEIHSLPSAKQKEILEKRFHDWKKDLQQVDDILVIGIRI